MHARSLIRIASLAVLVLATGSVPEAAAQSDHYNLERGFGASVEDAFPIAARGRELQASLIYDRTAEEANRFRLEPRIEVAPGRNWQASVSVPVLVGSAEKIGSGNIDMEALYNFNMESVVIPAFAVAGAVEFPTGDDADGIDTTLNGVLTKTLGATTLHQRVHVNLAWMRNAEATAGEREDRYRAIIGYSVRLGPDTVVVADVLREQDREKDTTISVVEIGARRQLTPLTVLSFGAGFGVTDESPDVRVLVGYQRSF